MGLLDNNTSASNTFPGWPNGVAKASAIGLGPLGIPQALKLGHRCDWWGYGNHPDIGIKSNDPTYCAQTAADMKARGLDGCILDWYGSGSNEDKSLLVLKPQLEAQGLKFALCIDGGTPSFKTQTDDTAALITQFDYANKTYFSSPAYAKYNGRPIVLFFGPPTCDWAKVRAHIQTYAVGNPLLFFRWELGYGTHAEADGFFGWTHCDENWVTAVKAKGKLVMLGVNGGFNSSIKTAPVNCTWGSGTIIPQQNGQRLLDQLALCKAHPEIPFVQFNTWNDYQEGSALEPGIATGFVPTLSLSGTVLSWTQLPATFDYAYLYVTTPSGQQHNIGPEIRTGTYDLAQMLAQPGKYTFQVLAVGKNSIQNVLSNALQLTLSWS